MQFTNGFDHFREARATPSSNPEGSSNQIPAPVANMTRLGSDQQAHPSIEQSNDPALEMLDERMKLRAEKANANRDKQDGTYGEGKRKSGPNPEVAATKRQRQAAPRASGSGLSASTSPVLPYDDCDKATRTRRRDLIDHIEAHWATEFQAWPVYEFFPIRLVNSKGPQRGRELKRRDEPQDWGIELLEKVHELATLITQDEFDAMRDMLRRALRERVPFPATEVGMNTADVAQVIERFKASGSVDDTAHRSPTLAATMPNRSSNTHPDPEPGMVDLYNQPRDGKDDRNPQLEPGTVDNRTQPSNKPVSLPLDPKLMEQFINQSKAEDWKKCIEKFQAIFREKERHEHALKEQTRDWLTQLTSHE